MRWFPFSSFRVQPLALYLSDHTLAVLRLNKDRRVVVFGYAEMPQGIVEDGRVIDRAKLAEEIRRLCASAQPKPIALDEEIPVIFSIPESQSFTHIFTIPSSTPKEDVAKEIHTKASHLIPDNLDHLYWDWHTVKHDIGAVDRVFFAAVHKEIIDAYIAVCEECNLLPLAIDMETISLARALLPRDSRAGNAEGKKNSSVIMDIGARTTTLGFFDEFDHLGLSLSVPVAGDAFTRTLMEHLKISREDAEAMKREQGMDRNIPDNRTLIILQERLQAILHECVKAFTHFESTYRQPITKVILAGGSSLLPGITPYFAMNMKPEVTQGDPFCNLEKSDPMLSRIKNPTLFAPVIGLALRALAGHPEEGINLLHGWEGERWEEREHKILDRWKKLALPIFGASIILFSYILYAYIYLPYVKTKEENISRISLTPEEVSSITAPLSSDLMTGTENEDSSAASTTQEVPPLLGVSAATGTEPEIKTVFGSTMKAKVAQTPTGWLNVRSGPGSTFSVIKKIIPGEIYPILDERDGWVLLGHGADGWTSAQYIEKTTN